MYSLDWVQRLKLGSSRSSASAARIRAVSPVVWAMGLTSLLTDISSEMVSSILPVYLVLHLRLSPLQFAAIDGIYNGLSVALVAVAAGFLADRSGYHKYVAALGYAASTVCKLGLLAAGSAWGLITVIVGIDRLGKGVRTAPRDSIISLHTPPELLGAAFGVHRALDAAGALLGPLVAFALLALLPGAFDVLWVVSFVVGCLGVAALWLFVPRSQPTHAVAAPAAAPTRAAPLASRRFALLAACGTVLAMLTISDGFIYLLLQQKSQAAAEFIPLLYVGTATAYMLFAVPAGLLADRVGRTGVFVAGYAVLLLLYVLLLTSGSIGVLLVLASVAMLGLYYAATEGVLMALASAMISRERRTTGLAVLATSIGLGKLISSMAFGWLWQMHGVDLAVGLFAAGGAVALGVAAHGLRRVEHG